MQTQLLPAHLWQTCIQGTVVKASQVCSKDPSRHIMAHFLPTSKKIILILAVGGSGHKDREDKKWPYLWSEIHRKTRDPASCFVVSGYKLMLCRLWAFGKNNILCSSQETNVHQDWHIPNEQAIKTAQGCCGCMWGVCV